MNLKSVQQSRVARNAPSLSCVWIATGNPRQPLACVWIDSEVSFVLEATGTTDQSAAPGEEHLGGLAA
jgi:hypothetical protein